MELLTTFQPSYRIRPQPGDVVVLKTDYHGGLWEGRTAGDIGIIIKTWYDDMSSVLFCEGASYIAIPNDFLEVIDKSLRNVGEGWIEPVREAPVEPIPEHLEAAIPQEKPAESNVITVQGRKIRVTFSGNVLNITCAECGHVLSTLPIEDLPLTLAN